MVLHWLIAVVLIIFQEVVTFNALLFKANQGLYPLWAIHTIFVLATCFDIWWGYAIGKYAKKKFTKGRIVDFAHKMSERFNTKLGKRGRVVALLFLGTFSFPYVNSFIAAWLDLPFLEMFVYLFFGNLISYALSWVLVLGVSNVVSNPSVAGLIIVGLSLLVVLFIRKK